MEGAFLCAFDGGGLDFGAASHEGGGVGFVVDGEALPQGAFDGDGGGGDLRVAAEEKVGEFFGVVFHRSGGGVARDGVDGVLHGVGGEDFAVVAVEVGGVEISFEEDLHGPFAEVVNAVAAGDLHEADAGFSVAIFGELDHGVSFLGRWCSRWR